MTYTYRLVYFCLFPYRIRIRQCWIQLDGAADPWMKVPITLNLIKYATAFPPIWLAAAASLGYFHPDLPAITAVMATINSLYSYSVSQLNPIIHVFVCISSLISFPPLVLDLYHFTATFMLVGHMYGLGVLHIHKDRKGDSKTAYDASVVLLHLSSDGQLGPAIFLGSESYPSVEQLTFLSFSPHGGIIRGRTTKYVEHHSNRMGSHCTSRSGLIEQRPTCTRKDPQQRERALTLGPSP